jgi:hypothetical protein
MLDYMQIRQKLVRDHATSALLMDQFSAKIEARFGEIQKHRVQLFAKLTCGSAGPVGLFAVHPRMARFKQSFFEPMEFLIGLKNNIDRLYKVNAAIKQHEQAIKDAKEKYAAPVLRQEYLVSAARAFQYGMQEQRLLERVRELEDALATTGEGVVRDSIQKDLYTLHVELEEVADLAARANAHYMGLNEALTQVNSACSKAIQGIPSCIKKLKSERSDLVRRIVHDEQKWRVDAALYHKVMNAPMTAAGQAAAPSPATVVAASAF